ncbi:MAG: acyloxyacyl hydrolase [Eudoraea sp.]|nr:acyloxyacyl hydrolase [Eudoraea sp.]
MKCSACLIVAFGWSLGLLAQSSPEGHYSLDFNAYAGSILKHNPDISHLITNHPAGFTFSFNKKTFGKEAWQQGYNFPDTGFTLVYQDMNNETLGHHVGLYAHFNFYLLRRQLQLRIAQGLAYNTNPYDRVTNFRGNAYGSHLLSTTHLMLNYQKENVIDRLGVKGGITLVHYSNANVRAPNTSTNTFALNLGLIYALTNEPPPDRIRVDSLPKIREKIKLNLIFRSGINESDVVNSGQYPFYIISAYADKRLGRKSAVQLGGDVFFSNFLKELIRFQSIAFPENNVNADDDFKRIGLFVGHELFINKLSVVTQFGYYVYYPFDFEGRTYNRVGLKYYLNSKWYGALTLKSHAAKAEALELGIGIRL